MGLMKHKITWFALIFSLAAAGCVNIPVIQKVRCEKVSLPITVRSFLVGVTPTFDLNGTLEEIYGTAGSVADVMNLWFVNVPWYNTTEHLKKPETQGLLLLINSSGLTPIFQLNFWTIKDGKVILQVPPYMNSTTTNLGTLELRQLWIEQAVNISRDYHPRYFCIGNEIDTYYWNCSHEDFDNYVSLVAETYDGIKAASPNTMVFVVFRLDTIDSYNGWFLIEKFDKDKIDLFGFTSYPYMLGYPGAAWYENPSDMPSYYYTRIMNYTGDKPIVFSEIGWTSSERLRGGSEQEQVEFLLWFLEHTKEMPLEIVSWLCLHDLRTVEEETNPNAKPNDFVGLRYKNGTEKAIWVYWQALYAISYPIPEFPIAWLAFLSLMLVTLVAISFHKMPITRSKISLNTEGHSSNMRRQRNKYAFSQFYIEH
jgi:hypothetical protein